jgi:hypothetical protein
MFMTGRASSWVEAKTAYKIKGMAVNTNKLRRY